MAKLYPPIVENTLDAFYGNSITVPFTLNRAVGMSQISGLSLIIKSTVTNDVVYESQTSTAFTSSQATFSINSSVLYAGGFYKIQIAFIDSSNNIGYYSGAAVAKYIGLPPIVEIQDDRAMNDVFIGIYHPQENADITEKLYSYNWILRNQDNEIVETTGEQLHNSAEDVGLEQVETYTPNISFSGEGTYTLTFEITTINGFHTSVTQIFYGSKDDSGYIPRNMELSATMDSENGYMQLSVRSIDPANTRQLIYGKFEIYKLSSKDNFKERYRIAYFQLQNQDIFDKTFKDFTVEAGVYYRYVLVQRNDYGIFSEDIWNVEGAVYAEYDNLFLFDGIRQLKVKFNPQVSSFKNTIYETKTDTIGGQYPFIFRNANTKYKELQISGLISYQMDEQNLFLNDDDFWLDIEEGESAKDKWTTSSLNSSNFTAEREFKLKVLDWLNNGQVKLFKSPAEGNYIVRLLNVSLTPNTTVGRMLHTFTATGYEVEDVNKYQFCQALTIDKTNTYVGYATTPLYDWPNFRIWDSNNNKINIDNTKYEIIGSPNLEYVVGVQFEDIKPRTRFKVTLERNGEEFNFIFMIGATGFYVIPSELGFHIKRIRLVSPSFNVDDFGKDIINNRGQVTYMYERQAKHNNFNDITGIRSNINVSAPMYATEMELEIDTPLTTIEGTPVYEYTKIADDPGWIEVAYFTKYQNIPKIRGVDYKVENDKYYDIKNNDELLTLDTIIGYPYYLGEQVPNFQLAENPVATGSSTQTIATEQAIYYNKLIKEEGNYSKNTESTLITSGLKGALLFLQQYDSKGVAVMTNVEDLIEEDSEETIYLMNPYYSQIGLSQNITFKINDETQSATQEITINFTKSAGNNSYNFQNMTIQDTSKITVNSIFISSSDDESNNYNNGILTVKVNNITYQMNINFNNSSITFIGEQQLWNPSNSSINKTISTTPNIYVDLYKLTPVTSASTADGDNQSSALRPQIIQKNFIPNKYYNVTNIDGEYYLKEEIQNVYQFSFELIQVFYPEDISKIKGKGHVAYDDIIENAGYSRTTRRITSNFDGAQDSELAGGAIKLSDEEVYYDEISMIDPNMENQPNITTLAETYFEPISTLWNGVWLNNLNSLYGIDSNTKVTGLIDLICNYYDKIDIYYQEALGDASGLYKYTLITKVEKTTVTETVNGVVTTKPAYEFSFIKNRDNLILKLEDINTDYFYVNYRIQAYTNYINRTTPGRNEFIIVFTDSPNHIQRFDLTNRLSYILSADDVGNEDFQNIAAIYLGSNVRGFITYKRKQYSYQALVDDSISIELTPDGQIIEGGSN